MSLTTYPEAPAARELATLIHDDILQSLGVAVLGSDLCRRLHQRERYEDALDELTGVVRAMGAARESTERLLPDLRHQIPAGSSSASRPSLVVMGGGFGQAGPALPWAGPDEIAQTMAACEQLARRCRHQYDAGLGEDTMEDVQHLLQRLDFLSTAFRELMQQLRQTPDRPVVAGRFARSA